MWQKTRKKREAQNNGNRDKDREGQNKGNRDKDRDRKIKRREGQRQKYAIYKAKELFFFSVGRSKYAFSSFLVIPQQYYYTTVAYES